MNKIIFMLILVLVLFVVGCESYETKQNVMDIKATVSHIDMPEKYIKFGYANQENIGLVCWDSEGRINRTTAYDILVFNRNDYITYKDDKTTIFYPTFEIYMSRPTLPYSGNWDCRISDYGTLDFNYTITENGYERPKNKIECPLFLEQIGRDRDFRPQIFCPETANYTMRNNQTWYDCEYITPIKSGYDVHKDIINCLTRMK